MQFTHETSARVPLGHRKVLDHWSRAEALPRYLSHVRGIANSELDDIARVVIVLDGRHLEFAVQRTMCDHNAVCWQNLGDHFVYVLTVEACPGDHAEETSLRVTVAYDPPGFLPDILETLGRNKGFRHALESDILSYCLAHYPADRAAEFSANCV